MTTDANQIESLVRQALARLTSPAASDNAASSTVGQKEPLIVADLPKAATDQLELMSAVISTHTLKGKLKGITTVRVRSAAVITPAARDLLKEARIRVVRDDTSSSIAQAQQRPAALAVLSVAEYTLGLQRQLCPKRTRISTVSQVPNDVTEQLRQAISLGHRLGVVISPQSFAVASGVARDGLLSVRVASWDDFQMALAEINRTAWLPQIWVLDSRQWNLAATVNFCNHLYDHGYWRQRKETR